MNFLSSSKSTLIWLILLLFSITMISGCGESDSTSTDDLQSKLYLSLTDAEGDFTQYKVDVSALKLYRANGVMVETLPNATTLDFAQYVDVTEFLTTATVPVGYYSKAEITLDFTQSELSVENDAGESIPASAVDDQGQPLGVVTLETSINGGQGFAIRYGQPASLSLDFDLEASNTVVIDDSLQTALVTVNPILLANTSIDDFKTHRVRGLLRSVNVEDSRFDIDLRPFRVRHRSHGVISVNSNDETLYEINGQPFASDEGLQQLNRLPRLTPMVVLGHFNHTQKRYLATEVYAGSSVPWSDQDAVKGSIIARSGNTLSVLGATIEWNDGRFQFNDSVRIQISDTTRVTKQGSTHSVDISDLSIGQRVLILGEMTDDQNMDASNGLVRMRYSDLSGKVSTVSPLELDVQHINRRNVSRYDFAGTGIDIDHDADPDVYEIDQGSLVLNSLQAQSPVKVRGFPSAFATAPTDFNAKTIIDVSALPTRMFMGYGTQGSPSAIASLNDSGLLLDVESSEGRHHLKQAGVITDINDLPSVPWINANDGHALYAISQGRKVEMFLRWENFTQALTEKLANNDRRVLFVHATGSYDVTQLTLTSRRVLVRVSENPLE